jgi:hypothetical protein
VKPIELTRKRPQKQQPTPYMQLELAPTASQEHYVIVGHSYVPEEVTDQRRHPEFYWHSSQIMWRNMK